MLFTSNMDGVVDYWSQKDLPKIIIWRIPPSKGKQKKLEYRFTGKGEARSS